jgi:hypothetical protein
MRRTLIALLAATACISCTAGEPTAAHLGLR